MSWRCRGWNPIYLLANVASQPTTSSIAEATFPRHLNIMYAVSEAEQVAKIVAEWRSQCFVVCSIALIIWDIARKQVEYIWKSRPRISLIKTFFWFNRCTLRVIPATFSQVVFLTKLIYFIQSLYYPVSGLITSLATTCFATLCFTQIALVISVGVVESALALRIWALYKQSRDILALLIILVGGSTLYAAVINGLCLVFVSRSGRGGGSLCDDNHPSFSLQTCRNECAVDVTYCALRHDILYHVFWSVIKYALIGTFFPATYTPTRQSNFIFVILSVNCSRLILGIRDAFNTPERPIELSRTDTAQTPQPHTLTQIDLDDLGTVMEDNITERQLGERWQLETVLEEDAVASYD
ncbi:hypothetical protein K439DRAFT_1611820 [Ramaria rubella]|nr:hypothetical protein K439DRAFT_1611820 [Ramaria rubella]